LVIYVAHAPSVVASFRRDADVGGYLVFDSWGDLLRTLAFTRPPPLRP